jgi:ketosteroid isomerase-like protein
MTTRDVYDRHTRHELDGDLDTILSDYAPDAIVATPDGIGSGHDYVRQTLERVLPLISSLELTSSIQVLGDVVYLTFRAHRNGTDELIGTDTFVIRDDLIHMHTYYGTTPSTTADQQS